MVRRLAGIETEYGLQIDGRGAEDQIQDSKALVQAYPGKCLELWDYRYESPRQDLRGFVLDRLTVDPEDAKFDSFTPQTNDIRLRADRILPNGARFYNDHGHPEFATPECESLDALVRHDVAGQFTTLWAGKTYAEKTRQTVRLYKNNTDFHGASYGTHESYLAPRSWGFEKLFAGLLPMLIARVILVGAGKVGSEKGDPATYQISQRADFFMEAANAETLHRRPIFNTRDEPHGAIQDFIRVHVIAGDANMIPTTTKLKAGLVKLAMFLIEKESSPVWEFADPVGAIQSISRDVHHKFEVKLKSGQSTTAQEILLAYCQEARRQGDLDDDLRWVVETTEGLVHKLTGDFSAFRRSVDWAAKLYVLDQYGVEWGDPALQSVDLEYHNIDPETGLFFALAEMGEVDDLPSAWQKADVEALEPTRAWARGLAVQRFSNLIESATWSQITFKLPGKPAIQVVLPPDMQVPETLRDAVDVESFIAILRGNL